MDKLLLKILVDALIIFLTVYILKDDSVKNFSTAFIRVFLISIAKVISYPIFIFFSTPSIILTFSLFLFVIAVLPILLFHKFWLALRRETMNGYSSLVAYWHFLFNFQ